MSSDEGMTLLEVLLAVGLLAMVSLPAALLMGNVAQVEALSRFGVVATSVVSEQTAAVAAEMMANDQAVTVGTSPGPPSPFLQSCGPSSLAAAPCYRLVHGVRYGITPANYWIALPTSTFADPPTNCGEIDSSYVMSASGSTVVDGPPLILVASADVAWHQNGTTDETHESTLVAPSPAYFEPSDGYVSVQVSNPTGSILVELTGTAPASGTLQRYAEVGPGGCAFFVNLPPGSYQATPVSASNGTAIGPSVDLEVVASRGTVATVLLDE